ncbi:glycosyltransferase family 2 protein [Streptococcus pluranimalium]|uniref:Glycosyltransferase family 2 protein n=1 Tax=Streptococcus pluranimalium TaxID=82348 RepID=A0A2L0D301_9STRE|nr:glycosyltransferase family 2 protein [Streptococcus pluranimalium]AUW96207.1 glycosyltransferase family 2 protein [Streptococcus pluranimalium]
MKVNIVMSTYNGEKYLADQIKSIQSQTFEDWQLLIRDDGSSDNTPSIIRDMAKKDDRIHFINDGQNENYGVIKSFYHLVKYDSADYYFFSDQDDVWLPEKIEVTLKRAQSETSAKPLLVYTDLKVVNEDLAVLQESMIKSQSHHANTELVQELTENTVTGGTMMINKALADKWQVYDNLLMHDWYLALLAASLGKLIYIDQATQLYRQHEANVLGARTWSKRAKNWLKPNTLISKYWWLIKSSQNQAEKLLAQEMSESSTQMVKAYVYLMDNNWLDRWRLLREYKFKKNRWFHTFVFTILIITKLGYQ